MREPPSLKGTWTSCAHPPPSLSLTVFNLITVGSDYRLQRDDCEQRPMRTWLSRINSIFFLRARRANRQQHRSLPHRISSFHLPLSFSLYFFTRYPRGDTLLEFLTERSSTVVAFCKMPVEDSIGNTPINRLLQVTVYMYISMCIYGYHCEREREGDGGRKKEERSTLRAGALHRHKFMAIERATCKLIIRMINPRVKFIPIMRFAREKIVSKLRVAR